MDRVNFELHNHFAWKFELGRILFSNFIELQLGTGLFLQLPVHIRKGEGPWIS